MWQRLLLTMLLLLTATAIDLEFPGEEPVVETDSVTTNSAAEMDPRPDSVQTEAGTDDYDEYGPPVDPGDEGLEERFLFGGSRRRLAGLGKKLGNAASSFVDVLTSSGDESPPQEPGYRRSPSYGTAPTYAGAPDYEGYPDYAEPPGYGGTPRYGDDQGYAGTPVYGGTQRYRGPQSQGGYAARYGSNPGHSRAPDYGGGQNAGADYGDYEPQAAPTARPQHGFPVDKFGRIVCGGRRLNRRKKKACKKASKKQRRLGIGGKGTPGGGRVTPTTVSPVTICPSVPDQQAMSFAQESCCGLQLRGNLYGFNNCCQRLGFCPVCEVDSEKLAQDECCPLFHDDNQLEYRRCCSKYGTCPTCGPAPTPEPHGPVGCLYKAKLYAVGQVIDKLAQKCMFIRCKDNGQGPETVLEFLDKVGCCEKTGEKDLFPPDAIWPQDECTKLVCEDSKWVPRDAHMAAIFSSPCPDGWLDLGGSCVFIWRELMTFNNATIACGKLRSTLALPQNRAQLTQLINTFRDMEGRDSKRELGGWVNAQHIDRQWQTLQGDTLTFAPWEEGSPDTLRRTNCAGLTVTDQSQGWKDYMCNHRANMLYPICQVNKPDCGVTRHGCGPYEGDMMFAPGSEISIFSNQCERFMCNDHSYVVRQVNPECCYHHQWNARAHGRNQGWYTGLFPPGGFQLYEGLLCDCANGKSDCTNFFA